MEFLFYLSCAVIGFVVGRCGMTITDWEFWVIIICASLNGLFGYLMGQKEDKS